MIEATIVIQASRRRVWEVLTDFDAYERWNPFIIRAAGVAAKGGRLEVFIRPPGQAGMAFRPVLTAVEAGAALRWRGAVGATWLFAGAHSFELADDPSGGVRFTQSESFSGLLAPMLATPAFLTAARQGFEAMNVALKERAESQA